MKLKILLCVLTFVFNPSVLAEETFPTESSTQNLASSYGAVKTLPSGRYIGGGIVTLFLSWGIGHAVQGRYAEKGWIFTVGGATSTIGTIGLYVDLNKNISLSWVGYGFAGMVLVGLGLRVWELIDVWMLPSNYTLVKEKPFQIQPLAFYDQNTDLNLGLSLNYKF